MRTTRTTLALISVVVITVPLITLSARDSRAADSCDGGASGATCPDNDGDGWSACGCALSGSPCDCNDNDPNVYPSAPEACDSALDTNCNNKTNEVCSDPKRGCFQSVCVAKCIAQDDFGCPPDSNFSPATDAAAAGGGGCLCLPKHCGVFGCPPGSSCDETKTCVPTCGPSVRCPFGQRCSKSAGCVDPCGGSSQQGGSGSNGGVTCPTGISTCRDGRCVSACDCAGAPGCPAGESCDATKSPPACVETACIGIACSAEPGTHCEKGTCVDDCAGVVCPPRLVCKKVPVGANGAGPIRGRCIDLCNPDPCTSAFECEPRTGGCVPRPTADGGLAIATKEIPGGDLHVTGGGPATWSCSSDVHVHAQPASVSVIGIVLGAFTVVLARLVMRKKKRAQR